MPCACGNCPACEKRQYKTTWQRNRRAEDREKRTGSREVGERPRLCNCGLCERCKKRECLQRWRHRRVKPDAPIIAPPAESVAELDASFPWLAGLDFNLDD